MMTTKDITYGKTETWTKCIINLDVVTLFLSYAQPSGDLVVYNFWVYTPGGSPKKKDMVYTPMGGSPTISVLVYAHFYGSPKFNQNTRW